MITSLLREDGSRWLAPYEQIDLPSDAPNMSRPVWLYLSLIADKRRLLRENGLGIRAHMDNLRKAFGGTA